MDPKLAKVSGSVKTIIAVALAQRSQLLSPSFISVSSALSEGKSLLFTSCYIVFILKVLSKAVSPVADWGI